MLEATLYQPTFTQYQIELVVEWRKKPAAAAITTTNNNQSISLSISTNNQPAAVSRILVTSSEIIGHGKVKPVAWADELYRYFSRVVASEEKKEEYLQLMAHSKRNEATTFGKKKLVGGKDVVLKQLSFQTSYEDTNLMGVSRDGHSFIPSFIHPSIHP